MCPERFMGAEKLLESSVDTAHCLSQQPELNGVLFRAFKKDEGDPGELHAEAYYYPLS